ncbi:hypothetical protein [Petrachloros mirabilis]
MAYHNIERYMARWNYEDHYGEFNVGYRTDGAARWKLIRVSDPSEFAAMIDLLRNEKPVYYADHSNYLQTSHSEFVGEGESETIRS